MTTDFDRPWSPSADLIQQIGKVEFDLQMNAVGRTYVDACVKRGPSRKVEGRRGNALVKFTSNVIGVQVMLESRRGEFPLAVLADADKNTVCFFAQAPELNLAIKDVQGRVQTTTTYTPDLLVVRRNEIVALEARDLTRLCEQNFKNPYQFYRDDNGCWHYRAAEEALAALGIKHQLIDNDSIPSVVMRNVRFLEDYILDGCPRIDSHIAQGLVDYIKDRRFVPMRDLLREGGFAADDVFKAVAGRLVYVNLSTDLLPATDELVIYSDAAIHSAHRRVLGASMEPPLPVPGTMHLRSGSSITYDKKTYRVSLVGERDISVQDEHGIISTLPLSAVLHLHKFEQLQADGFIATTDKTRLSECSTDELERALKRLDAVENPKESTYCSRSLTTYRRIVNTSVNRMEALIALVDGQSNRGNRRSRVSEVNRELGRKWIEVRYNTPEVPSKKSVYLKYSDACHDTKEESGLSVSPISYTTFCEWCDEYESVLKRKGKRANYQASRIVQSLDSAYPVHGSIPHDVCYIDHTIINLATVSPNGVDLGKPTLTLGMDGHTTNARAMILSYDPPSAMLVLLLLRDYVRRWGRLPRIISVDNGKEFHSKELAFFCKIYGIEIRYRPPGMPRGGSPIERMLGATEEEVIGQMQGNTRQMKDPRLVTKSVNPFNRAIWTLTAAYGSLDEYLFKIRPDRIHPALGMSPKEYEIQRLNETGSREHIFVAFDENLMLMTSPHARLKHHKVDQRRGVWVDGAWYQHPLFRSIRKGTKIEIRVEPWLHRVVYALVHGKWIAAIAGNSRLLGNRTRREVEIAMREEKRLATANGNKATLDPKNGQKMLALWTPERFDPRISDQQKEMWHLYKPLNMTVALLPPEALQQTDDQNLCASLRLRQSGAREIHGSGAPSNPPLVPEEISEEAGMQSHAQTPISDAIAPGAIENVPGYY